MSNPEIISAEPLAAEAEEAKKIYAAYELSDETLSLATEVEDRLQAVFRRHDRLAELNQFKVLDAFRKEYLAETDFAGSTGYGYGDSGRDKLERIYARVMGAEAALVRQQISSGTHAIATALFGILRPGDELLSITGTPYDTLHDVIGIEGPNGLGSLADFGITYRELPLVSGEIDFKTIAGPEGLKPNTKMVILQRSRGYANRPSLTIDAIQRAAELIHKQKPDCIVFVDNCYGEFVELREPTQVGVDLIAGSLIKNPGGGLAPTGGYVVGRQDLVDLAAARLTAPGVGSEIGASLNLNRTLIQGFYLAPRTVSDCLKGLDFAAAYFESVGLKTNPGSGELRRDLIQMMHFESAEQLTTFCQAVQAASPVDSFVTPVPGPMPGYDVDVIMAAGAFVQGSSIELSADGPLREPYMAFMQGGLVYANIKLAVLLAAEKLRSLEA